jgi:hypothetical protein
MSIIFTKARADVSTEVRPDALLQARPTGGRLTVPWKTVLPLAVVLAYADGFWLTSLRSAIGAIERTQAPFASWLRESTLVLPVYVFAVLAVLSLALRWFGPVLTKPRTVATTALLIVAAGTLVGLAATVASSAYDYHLQSAQMLLMQSMSSMHGTCSLSCLAQERHDTLVVHIRGVLLISRWLLLTNLVLVAWVVAVWGGRLKVSTAKRAPNGTTENRRTTSSRVADLRLLLVGALLASAAIHAALVPGHLTQWAGASFIFLAVWELVVAAMLLARLEERMVLLAAAGISTVGLVLSLYSHTTGLPDLLACSVEVASLFAAIVLLRGTAWLARPSSAHLRGLIFVGLIAVAAIGVAGTGPSWFDVFGISANQPVMDLMNMSH